MKAHRNYDNPVICNTDFLCIAAISSSDELIGRFRRVTGLGDGEIPAD